MPEILKKREPSLLQEIERFLQKKRGEKLEPLREWISREQLASSRSTYSYNVLIQYWLEVFNQVRHLPHFEFRGEVAELRQELGALRVAVDAVKQESESLRRKIKKISEEVSGICSPVQMRTIASLCQAYIEMVSSINIVQRVWLVEAPDVTTIWTIIDAPPFEDLLRTPIYDAQLQILRMMKAPVPLDFDILNIRELPKNQKLDDIIPASARLLWER